MTLVLSEIVNIAARFTATAERLPDKAAVIEGDRTVSFKALHALADRYAHALGHAGIGRGTRTVLMVTPGVDFFALTFALFKIGAVPVMVDPGMGLANLKQCLAEAEPEAFVGIPKAHAARVILGWGRATIRSNVTVGRRLFWGGHTLDRLKTCDRPFPMAETRRDDLAAILFTSGSTGVPKGAVYTHGTFDAQVEFLTGHFAVSPDDVDLPTFPLFALFDAALGQTAVIPKMDFTKPGEVDPEAIIGPIRAHGVTSMFGSPALLDRVGRYGAAKGVKLESLKRVISAGAPVPPAALERFAAMLPEDALIHTPYGATEALPISSITHREILGETAARWAQGEGTCVGRPLPGLTIELIGVTDEPIENWSDDRRVAVGCVGEICVKGPNVTAAYFNRAQSNALGKIRDVRDGGIWHRMGDLGVRDDQGRIWFYGRKTHRVTTNEGTLFTIPTEAIFNQHPEVYRSALVGVGKPGEQTPVICVELEAEVKQAIMLEATQKRIRAELLALASRHPHTRHIRHVLFHPAFPVDIRHNAKIFREKLVPWAEEWLK